MTEKLTPNYSLADPQTDIYVGDCREILPGLHRCGLGLCADLIFADPPFNIGARYSDNCDDNLDNEHYRGFLHKWIAEAAMLMQYPAGGMWMNIPDRWAAEAVIEMKAQGLSMVNWVILHQRFGQWRDSNFILSKTHLLYFARDRRHRTWNPDAILEPSDRARIYNDPRTQRTRRPGKRVPLDVWYGKGFGRVQGNNPERVPECPNQIPEAVLRRIILSCSNEGDLVLDPFLGSGTTSVVARALNRRSIGIEISEASATRAFERIERGAARM